ncbi:MAG TPA: hypothetical protein VGR06_24300 [Actinophytocola sp.]|jgi:hypothetical protein|uniref:hypothetical protein n=1 Tax=Actinophytocola sp. TaxID=1872138 RepID=UPI002E0CC162|nr:hypothetical protein [Actinophytocola sp.]
MTYYDQDASVEQILFGLTPKGGLGVKKYSVGLTPDAADKWDNRLSSYNRLSPTAIGQKQWVPDRAFSYFEFADGWAALLARFNTGESGRNNSHALVGPSPALGAYAMFLSGWDRWYDRDPGHTLGSVSPYDWQHLVTTWTDHVRIRARDHRAALNSLVREVLLGEAEHYTVLTDTDSDPLVLLTLARSVLDPVLSSQAQRFSWTFSTYERSDTDPEASPYADGSPRFWCLRSLPTSGQSGRRRVLVDPTVEDDLHAGFAAELITQYLNDPSRYPQLVEDQLAGITDARTRIAKLLTNFEKGQPHISRPAEPVVNHLPARTPDQPRVAAPVLAGQRGPTEVYTPPPAVPPAAPRRPSYPGGGRVTEEKPRKRGGQRPAHVVFEELGDGRNLDPDQRSDLIGELRVLWQTNDPYEHNARLMMLHFEKRVTRLEIVILLVMAAAVLITSLAVVTAQREITVPTQPTAPVSVPANGTPQSPTGGGGGQ